MQSDRKWDLQTGWPTKDAWTDVELDDIAEFFEQAGKVPEADAPYTRKPNPFDK